MILNEQAGGDGGKEKLPEATCAKNFQKGPHPHQGDTRCQCDYNIFSFASVHYSIYQRRSTSSEFSIAEGLLCQSVGVNCLTTEN